MPSCWIPGCDQTNRISGVVATPARIGAQIHIHTAGQHGRFVQQPLTLGPPFPRTPCAAVLAIRLPGNRLVASSALSARCSTHGISPQSRLVSFAGRSPGLRTHVRSGRQASSDLWRLLDQHFETFQQVYDNLSHMFQQRVHLLPCVVVQRAERFAVSVCGLLAITSFCYTGTFAKPAGGSSSNSPRSTAPPHTKPCGRRLRPPVLSSQRATLDRSSRSHAIQLVQARPSQIPTSIHLQTLS